MVHKTEPDLYEHLHAIIPKFENQSASDHNENDILNSLTSNDNLELRKLIGYIDFLGVFHCDIDPKSQNGYLAELIEDKANFFNWNIVDKQIKIWKERIKLAYKIMRDIQRYTF